MPTSACGASLTLSTRGLRRDQQADFWVEGVASALVRIECGDAAQNGIEATLEKRDFGLFSACEIAANAHAVVRSTHAIRADHRDSLFVCLMRKGQGYTFQGVGCTLHGPGDVVIYDVAAPYGHGFPADMAMTVLDISRPVFEAWLGPWRQRDLRRIDHGKGLTQWASARLHALLAQTRPATAQVAAQVTAQVTETRAARMLELLRPLVRADKYAAAATKSALHTLQRARDFIDQHLACEHLDVHRVSRAMRLSPRQLGRIFSVAGVSPMRYIWLRRLEKCRADLRDPALDHLTIGEIAFRWGFNDGTHFSHRYRARFDETPSQTRAGGKPV